MLSQDLLMWFNVTTTFNWCPDYLFQVHVHTDIRRGIIRNICTINQLILYIWGLGGLYQAIIHDLVTSCLVCPWNLPKFFTKTTQNCAAICIIKYMFSVGRCLFCKMGFKVASLSLNNPFKPPMACYRSVYIPTLNIYSSEKLHKYMP